MADQTDQTRDVVEDVLELEVERVDSPDKADQVVERAEQLAAGTTEEAEGREKARTPESAATDVARAAESPSETEAAARVLVATAGEAVAPTDEAPAVVEAVREVLEPAKVPESPAVQRGRSLLRQAVIRRMAPLQALDASLYVAINGAVRPRWLDRAFDVYTTVTTGGWIWLLVLAVAMRLRVPRAGRAFALLAPSVVATTLTNEYVVKSVFRRRRPFITIVRSLVVGKKPGSWSFPSGHTASAVASAVALSGVWPRLAALFWGFAALVGFSRVYVGAHYPGDVLSGAFFGAFLAEQITDAVRVLLWLRRSLRAVRWLR